MDEGKPGQHKLGFVAQQPGAWLEFEINTTLSGTALRPADSGDSDDRSIQTLVSKERLRVHMHVWEVGRVLGGSCQRHANYFAV